jgi:hypothetical protein
LEHPGRDLECTQFIRAQLDFRKHPRRIILPIRGTSVHCHWVIFDRVL